MAAPFTHEIAGTLDALTVATDAVSRWLRARAVPPAAGALAQLGLEELVTNCIKYGYDDDPAHHVIRVSIDLSDGWLRLTVEDDGRPFDPVAAAPPDLTRPVDERPVGGLGLHLLRTMSDRIHYERRGGRNRVTLEKALA